MKYYTTVLKQYTPNFKHCLILNFYYNCSTFIDHRKETSVLSSSIQEILLKDGDEEENEEPVDECDQVF